MIWRVRWSFRCTTCLFACQPCPRKEYDCPGALGLSYAMLSIFIAVTFEVSVCVRAFAGLSMMVCSHLLRCGVTRLVSQSSGHGLAPSPSYQNYLAADHQDYYICEGDFWPLIASLDTSYEWASRNRVISMIKMT